MPQIWKLRPLYLLALLQLVAGPLILLPCVLVSKVVTSCSQEKTTWAKIVRVCDGETWQQAAESSLKLTLDSTKRQPDSVPIKPKQTKDSIVAIEWNSVSKFFNNVSQQRKFLTEPVMMRKDRTQSPAIPPPRYRVPTII